MKTMIFGLIALVTFVQGAFALDCGEGFKMRFLNSAATVCHAKCFEGDVPVRLHNGQSLECCNAVEWVCETDYGDEPGVGIKDECQRKGNNALVSELYVFGGRRQGVHYDYRCVLEDARKVTPHSYVKATH